jgi:nicotinate-nucleotide adenylyltransferase
MMRRLGLLGGTFDPVHRGHVELARLAQSRLGLERVLLAPVGAQPLKAGEVPGASWENRLHMVELAVGGISGLEASAIDAPRANGRPNFSSETVARLADALAVEAGADEAPPEIIFLMGADTFAGFRRWHDPEGLMRRADLAVASRPGFVLAREGSEILKLMPEGAKFLGKEELRNSEVAGGQGSEAASSRPEAGTGAEGLVFLCGSALVRIYLLEELAEDIAATELRAELALGRGWDWLDPRVAEYVRESGLYGRLANEATG